MILTVTPNVAIDRTYRVPHVELGHVHKVADVIAQVGGKGVNVARALARSGRPTLACGLFCADGLAAAEQSLRAEGIPARLFGVGGTARQTITIMAGEPTATTTAFDEPGPTVSVPTWSAFVDHAGAALGAAELAVVAGSLPPGTPVTGLAELTARLQRGGAQVLLDARGEPLSRALAKRPAVVKLNRGELGETLGGAVEDRADALAGAEALRELGAGSVIVTLGEAGAVGVDVDGAWEVTHARGEGNPIGAGDAFSAGFAATLLATADFAESLRQGAAGALASLRTPAAGWVNPAEVTAAAAGVEVHRRRPHGSPR